MNLQEQLKELAGRGLMLQPDGDQLRVKGPKQVLTPAVQSFLKQHKIELLKLLELESALPAPALTPITPSQNAGDQYPLSFAQRRFWFLHQLEPDTSVYHVSGGLEFRGILQIQALERALNEIVQRHQILRTVFPETDGSPCQRVQDTASLSLRTEDLRDLRSSELEPQVERLVNEVLHHPFDLRRGPLFRVRLLLLGPQRSQLLICLHHIIADGTSLEVFARELGHLYRQYAEGLTADLPGLAIQYNDYACWQHAVISDQRLQSQTAYWRQRLAGAPPLTTFPADASRPPTQSYRGAIERFTISAETIEPLRQIASQCDSTLFIALLSAYAVLLSKYTRQPQVVLGTPVGNRPRQELEPLIGLFANTIALHLDLTSAPTFTELLEQTREAVRGGLENQDIPFEQLVADLQTDRDPSYSPVLQTMLVLRREPLRLLDMGDIDVIGADVGQTTARLDSTLELEERADGIAGTWEYASDLYRPETVRRMIAHFQTLLHRLTDQPDHPIASIPLTTDEEYQQVVHQWNETRTDYPCQSTIHQLFEEQVAKTPDAPAVRIDASEWTYDRLNREADGIAIALADHGIQPDELIGICCRRSLSLVAGLVGILKGGGAYVPLDPDYPEDRLRFMIGDTATRAILVTEDLLAHLQELVDSCALEHPPVLIDLDGAQSSNEPSCKPTAVGPTNLAYCLYTSGSTGRPKGTLIPHRGVVRLVRNTDFIDISPEQVFLQFAPISFDLSTLEIWGPLLNGGKLVLMPPGTPSLEELGAVIRENGVTTLWLIAGMFRLMVDERIEDLGGLQQLIAGGDVLSVPHVRKMKQRHPHCHMINGYGPTENTTFSSCYDVPADNLPQKSVPIGRPIANSRIYIVDESMQAVPVGVPGELLAAGDGLARGYLNRPDLTSERFIPNPMTGVRDDPVYRTGDLARYLHDGTIEFLGRLDQQAKVRGYRVEPGELESVLDDHDLVREAAALVRETQGDKKELAAYVVCHGDASTRGPVDDVVGQLRTYLREQLPDYMVPATITILDQFPLNANGKVDRAALPEPAAAAQDGPFEAPRNEIEATLCRLWSDVIGVSPIGIRDNFFESGGDSIQSIQIVSRARQEGIWLTPRLMLRHQTVAELATAATASASTETPLLADRTDGVEWTSIQRWFHELDQPEPHHFNQAILLEVDDDLEPDHLRQAIEALVRQHPALRTCHQRHGEMWSQHESVPSTWAAIETVRLGGSFDSTERLASDVADRAQASLDLASGAVIRAVVFDTDPGQPTRLLLVIHHLAIDGVSWRILLQDLALACDQLRRGELIRLAPVTSPPAVWAARLARYVHQEMPRDEQDYWHPTNAVPPFTADIEGPDNGLVGSEGRVTTELDDLSTEKLLRNANRAYRTQTPELLIAALSGAIARCLGTTRLRIDLEGHGREDLFPDVDLSRTIGWLTSLYPVVLDAPSVEADAASTIPLVKKTLRSVPDGGIGYGAARFLGTASQRARLKQTPVSPIVFNYLGQTDQLLPTKGPIRFTEGPIGRVRSPVNRRPHLIEINALVRDGRLRLEWLYSGDRHHRGTIQRLATAHLDVLREYLDHCVSCDASSHTPADFPLADLDQASVDHIGDTVQGAVEDILPLAPTQQGILFHREANPDSDAYIVQLRMRIVGPLDEIALEQAWSWVMARHSALRAAFVEDTKLNLHQVIVETASLTWNRLDWQDMDDHDQRQALDRYCDDERRNPFDLAAPPLFRLSLIRTGSQVCDFVWTCHHVLVDGWSMANILYELTEAYTRFRDGHLPEMDPASGYASYLTWLSSDRRLAPARDYWARELGGFAEPSTLRVELAPPQGPRPEQRDLNMLLDRPTSARLNHCARQHHVTLNALMQAAWSLTMRQFSGADDILFGATVSGRGGELPGAEQMVGLFINSVPVRIRIDADQPVAAWLLDLQEGQLERDLHSCLPLVDLAAMTDLPGGTALFQHLLVFENYPVDASLRAGETPFDIQDLTILDRTNYPLTIAINPGEEIRIRIVYDPSTYEAATVETIAAQLEHFLGQLVDGIGGAIRQLSTLPPAERHRTLETWNQTHRTYPLEKTLMDLFEEQVERTPDAKALVFEGRELTYRELDRASNRLASRLKSMGAGPDTLIGISMERSVELVVGLYAILKADAAYVPIDPDYPDERVHFMLEDSGITLLLTQSHLLERLSSERYRILALDTESLAEEDDQALSRAARPHNLAYMIYTSGSTGRPKGVMNTHLGICNRLFWMQDTYPLGATDRVLQKTPYSFDVSVWEFFWPLQVGATLVVAKPKGHLDSHYLAQRIQQDQITTIHFVPSMLQIFLGEKSVKQCTGLKQIICSGESLGVELANQCRQILPAELHNLYGPTEAAVDVSSWACPKQIDRPRVPIGRPIANTALYVLDSQMAPLPVGVPGELHIGGICLARGYHNRPDLTASRFVSNPFGTDPAARLYKTGDLARYLPDGNIEYLGRLDHQVKIRGFRIELEEIENVLSDGSGITDCVVRVRNSAGGEAELVAYYVTPADGSVDALDNSRLRDQMRRRLPEFMVPTHFVALQAIPLSPNGKVDRQALPDPSVTDAIGGADHPLGEVEEDVAQAWSTVLGLEEVGRHDNFFDLGGHSLRLTRVHRLLEERFGDSIPGLIEMFQLPTVRDQALAISPQASGAQTRQPASESTDPGDSATTRDIAVIGMACRFPGAPDPAAFWRNLRDGVESITFFTDEELLEAGIDAGLLSDPRYVKANSIVPDADRFDAEFFSFSPRDAELLDPQHRLLLECSWESLESAGYDPLTYAGRVGVFAGCGANSYILNNLYPNQDLLGTVDNFQLLLANDKDYLSTRISYKLNLTGPSLSVQTACSTSLVAVALACRSLIEGHCDMVLAGGATLSFPQQRGYLHKEGMIFSSDGHCRAFDADADGMVGGNGAGAVLLKPLDAALADGDSIVAVIKGSALNNDGANKIGYTAPSEAGQARVIEQALATCGIEPSSIGYVETHGTGTALGDPIEIAALTAVHAGREPASCAIGSVKTNMGHLDAAAGIAGFMKAALCLQNGQIPPSLHYHRPNPRIDFASTPFYVASELQDWPRPDTHPRRAGVSSFGIGGTNAHVILEEPPQRPTDSDTRARLPFVLSARTPQALRETREQLRRHLAQNPTIEPGDLAFTLAVGRHGFETRGFTTASTTQQLMSRLEAETPDTGLNDDPAGDSPRSPVVDRRVAFMFPGQGAQWAGMGRELYETEPVFREQLDLCSRIILPLLGQNLLDVLFSRGAQGSEPDEALQQTRLTQPALFAVEYSLAQLWLSWGLTPDAMIGHSIGEYVAACLAGVFSLEDALRIVQERAHLMQLLPGGSMLAVRAGEQELSSYLGDDLDLAVRNTPTALVVAGAEPAIRQLNLKLEAAGILCQILRTSHAFHSRMMEPAVEPLRRVLSGVDLQPPSIRFISNVTGDWITADQATDASYWATHLRETVRFGDGLSVLLAGARYALLEIGPGRTLQGFVRGNPTRQATQLSFTCMLPPTAEERRSEEEILLDTLGGLWLEGVQVDWNGYFSHERRRRIPLPTYPFQRDRFWIDPPALTETNRLTERLPLEQWFWSPTWKQHRHADAALDLTQTRWLLFLDDGGLGATLAARLQSAGARVATVSAGNHFEQRGQMQFAAEPGESAHYRDLLKALQAMDFSPSDILHLWPLSCVDSPTCIDVDRGLSQSFYSLVELAQALGAETGQDRLRIHNVTSNLFSVLGEPLNSPLGATALGPVEVIPKEYEEWVCRNIDIDLLGPSPSPVEALWEECIRTSDESVALRAGYRWVRVFDQLDFGAESSTPVPIRQGAAYLITGGLGGIGFVLARHLAHTARANLVLIGRADLLNSDNPDTSIDDKKLERLEQLRSLGTRVSYYSADVTHPEQMASVVRQAEAEHGDIRGVIHAAGVAAGGVIQQRSHAECAAVIAPKVQGALVLRELFQTRKVDFIFLCSSTSAVLGEFGQVDYAAANLFQDVLASRSATEGPWICSVNWDTWAEIGMAAETDVPARLQETRRQILATGITCDEGTRIFERVLATRLQHVVVSTRNFQARLEHEKLFSAEAIALPSAATQLHARPELSSEFKAPESPTQTAVAGIWQNSLGIGDVGIDDDFFELGGDSLLATQVISRIREELGVSLPMPSFFNHPTLAGVADSIDTVRWATQAQAGSAQTSPATGEEQRETFEL